MIPSPYLIKQLQIFVCVDILFCVHTHTSIISTNIILAWYTDTSINTLAPI